MKCKGQRNAVRNNQMNAQRTWMTVWEVDGMLPPFAAAVFNPSTQ
jgi:hypothetical protein